MIQNSKIEPNKWYIHPGMLDTAIKVLFVNESDALVYWYNISGKKRKFPINFEYVELESFKRSPYWQEQGDWIEELPSLYI